MRILALATGRFAVPTLAWLASTSEHQLLGLVTRPNRQVGHRRHAEHAPAKELAQSLGLAIHAPPSANDADFQAWLREQQAEVLFVCDYGEILRRQTLEAVRCGGLNLHGSLLPKYRGAAPVQWAILRGESETGVSVIHMTPKLDAGPVLAQRATPILPGDDGMTLETRLAELGVDVVRESLDQLSGWDGQSPLGTTQVAADACSAPRLNRGHGEIDWRRPAIEIHNQIRALQPWPGAFTTCPGPHEQSIRVHIVKARPWPPPDANAIASGSQASLPPAGAPGTPLVLERDQLLVTTGEGLLEIEAIKPENRKMVSGKDFLHGYRVAMESRWG